MYSRKQYVAFIFALFAFGLMSVVANSVFAQGEKVPEWQQNMSLEHEAFRYTIAIPALSITVPTVVEVPVAYGVVQNPIAVAQSEDGAMVFARYKTNMETSEATMTAKVNGSVASYLTDGKMETVEHFPFSEEMQNTVSVEFSALDKSRITSDQLFVTLAPNVALPHTIAITGIIDGEPSVIVAEKRLEGTRIRFPETTAETFVITFELVQPLRIAELWLAQKGETVSTGRVRFLAQPNTSYTLYLDPDRSIDSIPTGGVSLESDEGVVSIQARIEDNVLYVPLDSDNDGMPDKFDNCVSVANPGQVDSDGNGRGDECDDYDRDGIMNSKDNCPDIPNRTQTDTDGDGIGNECDTQENRLTERSPWIPWVGMGIAGLVLVVLMGMSLRMKPRDDVVETGPQEEPSSGGFSEDTNTSSKEV